MPYKLMLTSIATILIFIGTFSQSAVSDSLVGYWSFDEDDGVKDLSGTGNDGIIHGDPKLVKGKVGDALEFDGVDDYVEIPDNPSISELNELSLSAWIRPSQLGPWIAVIEKAVHEDWSYGFFIESDATLSLEICQKGNVLVCCIGDFKVEVGTWYHIACTYDGSMGRLYVDGKLEGEMPASGPVNITTYPLTIGCRNGQSFFAGTIDEVTLWNKAVTLEEMQKPIRSAVAPNDKLTTTWGSIKNQ